MVIYGFTYSLGLLIGGLVVSYLLAWPWGLPFFLLALFCLWFFRDPNREIPSGNVAVSPADGKVMAVKMDRNGPTRVTIFLNVFDVHVNRTPIGGVIQEIRYQPGKFLVASREEATAQNEQNFITVNDGKTTVVFSQIAGLIARRIICYKKPGDRVEKGERIGLIKFGSRMDVFLGPEWTITVKPGERVSAGSSVIARMQG